MFKIKYDTPSLQIIYFRPQKFEGEYFISDLDSNLCAIRGWFTLPKTHSNITIKLNPDIIDKLTLLGASAFDTVYTGKKDCGCGKECTCGKDCTCDGKECKCNNK